MGAHLPQPIRDCSELKMKVLLRECIPSISSNIDIVAYFKSYKGPREGHSPNKGPQIFTNPFFAHSMDG
jgi:hypothetical protein